MKSTTPAHLSDLKDIHLPYGREFRLGLVKCLLERFTEIEDAVQELDSKDLEDPAIIWLYDHIFNIIKDHRRAPSLTSVKAHIFDFIGDLQFQRLLLDTLTQVINNDMDYQDVVGRIKSFMVCKEMNRGVQFFQKSVNGAYKDPTGLYNRMKGCIEKAGKIIEQENTKREIVLTPEIGRQTVHEIAMSKKNPIKIGIPLIEDALYGGLHKGRLYLLAGSAGSYKSMTTLNLAYYAASQGKKVLYIDMENNFEDMVSRLLARFTGMSYARLFKPDEYTLDESNRLNAACELYKKNVKVVSYSSYGNTNIEDLMTYIDNAFKKEKYDLLLVDYLDLFKSKSKEHKDHNNKAMVYWLAKSMAIKYNIPVVSPVQYNRGGINKLKNSEEASSVDVQGTIALFQIADAFVNLKRLKTNSGEIYIVWHLEKNRGGETEHIRVACKTNMTSLTTHSPELHQKLLDSDDDVTALSAKDV